MTTETNTIEREELAYETTTKACTVAGQDYTIADLRKTFDKVCNKKDWKGEWAAAVPHQIVGVVIEAVKWFHASTPTIHGIEPLTGKVIMSGSGYAAW